METKNSLKKIFETKKVEEADELLQSEEWYVDKDLSKIRGMYVLKRLHN